MISRLDWVSRSTPCRPTLPDTPFHGLSGVSFGTIGGELTASKDTVLPGYSHSLSPPAVRHVGSFSGRGVDIISLKDALAGHDPHRVQVTSVVSMMDTSSSSAGEERGCPTILGNNEAKPDSVGKASPKRLTVIERYSGSSFPQRFTTNWKSAVRRFRYRRPMAVPGRLISDDTIFGGIYLCTHKKIRDTQCSVRGVGHNPLSFATEPSTRSQSVGMRRTTKLFYRKKVLDARKSHLQKSTHSHLNGVSPPHP